MKFLFGCLSFLFIRFTIGHTKVVKGMKKKNMGIRVMTALLFLGLSGIVMFSIYSFSAENGFDSQQRSEKVTEKIKKEVKTKLETSEKGMKLSEKIQYMVIMHSPYGSDWNANVRKLAHFSIYFCLAMMIYITLAILGVNKTLRFILTIGFCFCFAFGDEYHQKFSGGRGSSMSDVYLDTFGALVSTCIWTVVSWMCCAVRYIVQRVNAAYEG